MAGRRRCRARDPAQGSRPRSDVMNDTVSRRVAARCPARYSCELVRPAGGGLEEGCECLGVVSLRLGGGRGTLYLQV